MASPSFKNHKGGGPACCPVVKFTCSASVTQGFTSSNPGHGRGTEISGYAEVGSHIPQLEGPTTKIYKTMYWGALRRKKEKQNLKKKTHTQRRGPAPWHSG